MRNRSIEIFTHRVLARNPLNIDLLGGAVVGNADSDHFILPISVNNIPFLKNALFSPAIPAAAAIAAIRICWRNCKISTFSAAAAAAAAAVAAAAARGGLCCFGDGLMQVREGRSGGRTGAVYVTETWFRLREEGSDS
jgi:hypothetical protein